MYQIKSTKTIKTKNMNFFNEEFKNKLYETIEDIENNSSVEIVGIIRQQSDKYRDIGFLYASIATGILYSIFIFIPTPINPYFIYLSTIVFYLLIFFIVMGIPAIHRKLIPKNRTEKSVDILSRAIFQKGGIRFTEERIGVLFFVSVFERKIKIIADRGAEMSVPNEEWVKLISQFDKIFENDQASDNFLKILFSTKEIFAKYIPPVQDDINELPDNLKVDL